jgi:YbgC/YbaW family acyl-CoA thioester hydrolase
MRCSIDAELAGRTPRGGTREGTRAMTRNHFRFLDRLRVRWAEIDAQKIVFNGHYLMYFDTAVAGYWRAMALPYALTMQSLSGDLYVRKATVEYHGSARYDDLLDVGMRCERIGTSSILLAAAVFRQDELLVSGELVYVFADPLTQTSRPVPPELRAVMEGFETGDAMVDVRVGGGAELGAEAKAIRTAVFVGEQKIPAAMEWDDADATAVHALARNRLGLALATGRMLEHAPGVARIGRMAVAQTLRGSGVGRAVLDALLQAARERGYREVVLHAQCSATGFYQRAGFAARGPVFEEAGVAHIEMTRAL